jgi:hypothetical protein
MAICAAPIYGSIPDVRLRDEYAERLPAVRARALNLDKIEPPAVARFVRLMASADVSLPAEFEVLIYFHVFDFRQGSVLAPFPLKRGKVDAKRQFTK